MTKQELKKTCIRAGCGNTFTCHGECFPTLFPIEGDLEFDMCFCPTCAKANSSKYSEKMRQVCPRFKDVRKEMVVFT